MLPISEEAQSDLLRDRYKELGNEIRHYSTVRSTLTAFLLTVSLTAFSAYFNERAKQHPFLLVAGFLALAAAIVACINFSFRTEKAVLRYLRIWQHLTAMDAGDKMTDADIRKHEPAPEVIKERVLNDRMNRLLAVAALFIIVAVVCFACCI